MNPVRRPSRKVFLTGLILSCMTCFSSEVSGQWVSPRLYLEAGLQTNRYSGDRSPSSMFDLSSLAGDFGPGYGFLVGYEWTSLLDGVFSIQRGSFPHIVRGTSGKERIVPETSSSSRTILSVKSRYHLLPRWGVDPFVTVGLGVVSGQINNITRRGAGPVLGFGATFPVRGLTAFIAMNHLLVYPNQALDRAGANGSPDALSVVSGGLRYRFKRRATSLGTVVVTGPSSLPQNENGIFVATTEADPRDVEVRWQIDGSDTLIGRSIEYAFREPGLHRVRVIVRTDRQRVERLLTVDVESVTRPVEIVTLNRFPRRPSVDEPVRFSPVVRGNGMSCIWDFGDGTTSSKCNVRHTFTREGTYRVRLRVSNADYSSSAVETVYVTQSACDDLPGMHAVYFQTNDSELTLEMRRLLRENFSTASACPNLLMEVTGTALSAERNPEELAISRAATVIQYYLNLGMSTGAVSSAPALIISDVPDGELPWPSRRATSSLRAR